MKEPLTLRFGITRATIVVVWVALSFCHYAFAEDPLYSKIDQLIREGNVANPPKLASDGEFLRRIFLDLAGTIPKPQEVRSFLADTNSDKRAVLIDDLLTRPDHARHLAITFDTWLMERRGETHVKGPGWRNFLSDSIAANKPYDQLVREILAADGTEEKNRDAARFYLNRLGEPDLISRDVGRIFFGQDLQCAQCHDHPTISDYLQKDYHGLFAFFGRTYLFQPDRKKPAVLAEKAVGGGDFKSVFTNVESTALPRVIQGARQIVDPTFEPGEEYKVKPDPKDKKLQPIPKYSRREQIATAAMESPAFDRNIVNRLWAHMMGRGLVEPFDFHHASNPATHPGLLDLLASEFREMDYDIRTFLRELALTETYQRKFELPASLENEATRVARKINALDAEEQRLKDIYRAAAKTFDQAKNTWNEASLDAAKPTASLAAAQKKQKISRDAIKKAEEALAKAKQNRDKAGPASLPNGKPNPKFVKSDAAVTAKQKALSAAQTKLDTVSAEVVKQEAAAETARQEVSAFTTRLEKSRRQYIADKTAWLVALRQLRDAESLIDYFETAREGESIEAKRALLQVELEKLRRESEDHAKFARLLKRSAASARAASDQFSSNGNLASAASNLVSCSAAAEAEADFASRVFEKKQKEMAAMAKEAEKQREKVAVALERLTERYSNSFSVGSLTHLTPEQFTMAMLQATGELGKLAAAGEADFTKKLTAQQAAKEKAAKQPPSKDKKAAAKKTAEPELKEADRDSYVRNYIDNRIKSSATLFIRLFGAQAGSPQADFFATPDQALFLSNGGSLRAWLRPSGDNLVGRLMKIDNPDEVAKELYLSILTREPDEVELASVKRFLKDQAATKSIALQELGWALLTSVEFRFKH